MRPYTIAYHLTVVTGLLLASFVGAGWKWDLLAH
jgi:hypothetical protein